MTSPKQIEERVIALEAKVDALQGAFTRAVGRLTAVEELLTAGQPRLTFLEEAARGFTSRVGELEKLAHAPSNADAARLATLEGTVNALAESVSRMGQVIRPGRSVVREQLTELQGQMAQVLARLPEAPQ